jgi:hypothetical protein
MKILILEDCPERIFKFKQRLIGHELEITKDTKYCIEMLKTQKWDYIFLDHDMGSVMEEPGEGTGYEVAKFIADNPQYCPTRIFLHTMNNIGASAMMLVLGRVEIKAHYIPLLWERVNI